MREKWFPINISSFDDYVKLDYFFRRSHSDKEFLKECCDKLFHINEINHENKYILVNNSIYISIEDNTIGAYSSTYPNFISLFFDIFGELKEEAYSCESEGFNIYYLFCYMYGLYQESAISELYRRLNINFKFQDRFTFNYNNKFMKISSFSYIYYNNTNFTISRYDIVNNSSDIQTIYNILSTYLNLYPLRCGYSIKNIYWYRNENNQINFGVIYFNKGNDIIKFPLVQLKSTNLLSYPNEYNYLLNSYGKLDLIHPDSPYNLFNKNIIYNENPKYIAICQDESYASTIDLMRNDFAPIVNTTWSGGYKETIAYSDWDYLFNKNIIIIINDNLEQMINAFEIYRHLNKRNNNFIGFAYESNEEKLKPDFYTIQKVPYEIFKIYNYKIISLDGFLSLVYRRYNVELDTSVIKKAISLTELKANPPETPKYLFDGLLRIGEQAMIFGPRAVGKSYFVYLLAVALANGISVLDNSFVSKNKYKVLIIDGEMDKYLIHQRLEAIEKGLNLDNPCSDNITILSSLDQKLNFYFSDKNQLARYKADIDLADVIILDSVTFTFPEAMGNNVDSAKNLNDFVLNNRKAGKTTIVVDHASTKSKKSSKDSFGSSAKAFALNTIISLVKNSIRIDIHITKGRSLISDDKPYKSYILKVDNDPDGKIIKVNFNTIKSNPINNNLRSSSKYTDKDFILIDKIIKNLRNKDKHMSYRKISEEINKKFENNKSISYVTVMKRIHGLVDVGLLPKECLINNHTSSKNSKK